jgi:hypothetical protein
VYIPISALPSAPSINGTEQIALVQAGVTKRISAAFLVGPILPPNGHVVTDGGVPTGVYLAGDGGVLHTVDGRDSAGSLGFSSGVGFAIPTTVVRVTFAAPWNSAPSVVLAANGFPAAAIAVGVLVSTTHFDIVLASAGIAQSYKWFWVAVGAPN